MKNNSLKKTALLTCFLLALFLWAGVATASLLVAPIRVVFSERSRSATVLILNTDTKENTYRMAWKLSKMKEDGRYEDFPEDPNDPYAVSKMVLVSPKQLTIKPDGRQNIRLSLRRPADLPPGEYRGHLVFETVPKNEKKESRKGGDGLQVGFIVSVGLSIPVIVRNQASALPDMTFDNIKLEASDNPNATGPRLLFDILRKGGDRSPYGRINIFLDKDGNSERLGQRNNIAIFNDVAKRSFRIDLSKPVPAGSKLRIVYLGGEEYAGQILAERTFSVD